MGLNLLPFVCLCFGLNKSAYRKIDLMYNKRKTIYEPLIKNSPLSSSKIINEHNIIVEDYAKKIIGIMEYLSSFRDLKSPDYLDVSNDWSEIVNEYFPLVSRFLEDCLKNNKEISIKKFIAYFIKKNKKQMSFNLDSMNNQIALILFIANNIPHLNIKNEDEFHLCLVMLDQMAQRADKRDKTDIRTLELNDTEKSEVRALMKRIDKKSKVKVRDYDTLNHSMSLVKNKGRYEWEEFLYDLEGLTDSFANTGISEIECEQLVYIFYLINKERLSEVTDLELFDYYTSALRYRLVLKTYNEAKDYYFKNAYDLTTVYKLEDELKNSKDAVNLLKQENDKLKMQLEREERKSRRLEQQLEEESRIRTEVIGLRDFFFNSSTNYIPQHTTEVKVDKVFAIVGGHEKWQQKIKQLLPSTIIIHTDQLSGDLKALSKADAIIFYPNYLNHAMYYRVISYSERNNIPVFYLNNTNESIVLSELQLITNKL